MILCPHCGAENADNSEFCSLCLARFNAAGTSATVQQQPQPQHYASPGDYRALAQEVAHNPQAGYGGVDSQQGQPLPHHPAQQQQPYVAPGDYQALAREMAQSPQAGYRDSAYYQAAKDYPGAISGVRAPSYMRERSALDIAIKVFSYSIATYLVLFALRFTISLILLGAAFGGSEAGLTFGIVLLFISDALVLALGGYAISAKAMHAGKGWMYGVACAAVVIFVWQPLVSVILTFLMTGDVYIPIFTLAGILFSLFLELPMGALGGWIAEKRLMG
ncbi:MAG: zinc-ribbon domain-containing protein [Actinobacteria bacterium]|nr:zinc-ribbon domain-containing protein [Actinomycetota bacterium]